VRGSGYLGSIFSSGTVDTNIGVSARVGDVRSVAPVWLRNYSTADGFVRTPGTLSLQQGAVVSAGVLNASVRTKTFSWVVGFPQGTLPDVILQPSQSLDRVPGNYASVIVPSGATLTLHSGTYTLRSLDLEPNATLFLDKSAGPIRVWIRDSFIYRGRYFEGPGRPGNYVFGYAGAGLVSIEAPYVGGALWS
jgi:hypothetical protein